MSGAHPQSHHMEENHTVWAPSNHQQHKSCEYFPAIMISPQGIAVQLFTVCCVSRLCTRKWRAGQLLVAMTYRYTTSRLAPPCSTPKANVCQPLTLFEKEKSKTCIWLKLLRSSNQLCLIANSHLLLLLLLLFPTPDEICPLPVQIPVVKPDPDRANPKIGVSTLAFSSDSRYLATKNGKTSAVQLNLHVESKWTEHHHNMEW